MSTRENDPAQKLGDRELLITRIFNAPRHLVFKAWAEPEHMAHWWGPKDYTLPVCEMDFRPGGSFRFGMRSPDGRDFRVHGVYREIVEPERLVLSGAWVEADGKPTGPETVTTVTFEEHDGKTKLTLHNTGFESVAARDSHRGGWTSSLERLAEYLTAEITG
jgi:uncharacterized protein YndB with AHSA1/START domain